MPCPQSCIPSPSAIDSLVPEKTSFKVFFTIYGHGSHGQDAANKLPFPLSIEDPYETWLHLAEWFKKRRRLKRFSYISQCKTSDPGDGAIFGLRAKIWTVEVHKIKLITKYQRPPPSSFRQQEF